LRDQLQDRQKTVEGLQLQIQLGQLRDAANSMVFEFSRQNYGLARDHASEFYNKLKSAGETVTDPNVKKSLEDLAATRDATMKELAMPTADSLPLLQSVVLKANEAARNVR
jgi:hypothetical protein